jgi:hypothetical protein
MGWQTTDNVWVLESEHGWKVVWCYGERPQGGRHNVNYAILADGMTRQDAVEMAKRLRRS